MGVHIFPSEAVIGASEDSCATRFIHLPGFGVVGFGGPVEGGESLRIGQQRGRPHKGLTNARTARRSRNIKVTNIELPAELEGRKGYVQYDRADDRVIGQSNQYPRIKCGAYGLARKGCRLDGLLVGDGAPVMALHFGEQHHETRDILLSRAPDINIQGIGEIGKRKIQRGTVRHVKEPACFCP